MSIKRFEQTPDSNVSVHRNPGFYVDLWPFRARLPLGTAQFNPITLFPLRPDLPLRSQ